jgi:hypothetical protein
MKQLGEVQVNDRILNGSGEEFTVSKVQSTTFTLINICLVTVEGDDDNGFLCWETGYSSDEVEVING